MDRRGSEVSSLHPKYLLTHLADLTRRESACGLLVAHFGRALHLRRWHRLNGCVTDCTTARVEGFGQDREVHEKNEPENQLNEFPHGLCRACSCGSSHRKLSSQHFQIRVVQVEPLALQTPASELPMQPSFGRRVIGEPPRHNDLDGER